MREAFASAFKDAAEVSVHLLRRRAFGATDGELHRERMPLVYEIRPRGLRHGF